MGASINPGRAGRVLSSVLVALFCIDAAGKLMQVAPVVEGTVRLGYPASLVVAIGLVELVCTALYAVPRTATLGALLLTAFLGGATATHVRIGEPFVFPILIGVLLWGSLLLREGRLRALLPLRSWLPGRMDDVEAPRRG